MSFSHTRNFFKGSFGTHVLFLDQLDVDDEYLVHKVKKSLNERSNWVIQRVMQGGHLKILKDRKTLTHSY